MSYPASNWALYFAQCPSASARYVLMVLADAHNGTSDECFPRIATICGLTGLPERTVYACLKQLEDAKLITRSRREDGTKRQTGVDYELHMQFHTMRHEAPEGMKRKHMKEGGAVAAPQGEAAMAAAPEGATHAGGRVQPMQPSKDNRERENKESNTEAGKPAKANVKPIYSEKFLELWEHVPKDDNPGSKSDAAKAFKRLSKEDQEQCIEGWVVYLYQLDKKREKRPEHPIKQCVTFINQRYWETSLEALEAQHG